MVVIKFFDWVIVQNQKIVGREEARVEIISPLSVFWLLLSAPIGALQAQFWS